MQPNPSRFAFLSSVVALALCGACQLPSRAAPEPERLTYSSYRPAGWDLYLLDGAGTEARRLTVHPSLDYDGVFSPDGRWVVFASERTGDPSLFVLDLELGGEPRLLVRGEGMQDQATISPDAGTIVFVSTHGGDADLYSLPFRPEETQALEAARNLTRHPGGDFRPAFSPDGQQIAFSSDRDGAPARLPSIPFAIQEEGDIYLMDTDGGEVERMTHAPGWDGSPSWSPDGASLLFYSERGAGAPYRVHSLELASGELVAVTPESIPALSPALRSDGSVLFSTWKADGPGRRWSVMSMDAAGDLQQVTRDGLDAHNPRPHATTGALLFHGAPAVQEESIATFPGPFLVEPSGAAEALLDRPVTVIAQRHSFTAPPDPRRSEVAFRQAPRQLGLAGSSGEQRSLLLDLDEHPEIPAGSISHLRFDEDGEWISFTVGPFGGPPDAEADAWRIRTDGSGLVNLTPGTPGNDGLAEFSSDGRCFVFRSGRTGDFDIFLASADGGSPRNLTDHPARDTFPALSPDGARLAFSSDRNGRLDAATGRRSFDLYTLEIGDDGAPGELTRVTQNESQNAHVGFSPDGEWLIYSSGRFGISDEQPLVQEVIFNPQMYGELYAYRFSDGRRVRLTHNKWEDGAPVWERPSTAASRPPVASALAGLIASDGAEAAVFGYHALRAADPGGFRFGEGGLLSLAGQFAGEGELAAAEQTYRVLASVQPDSARAHFALAELYSESGRPEDAASAYRSVLELDANNLEAQWSLFRMGADGYVGIDLPVESLDRLAGTYLSAGPEGEPAVFSREGQQLLALPPGAPGPLPFAAVSETRFFSLVAPVTLTFSLADTGEVEGVEVRFPDGREVFHRR